MLRLVLIRLSELAWYVVALATWILFIVSGWLQKGPLGGLVLAIVGGFLVLTSLGLVLAIYQIADYATWGRRGSK
ncbi:MAG: hypothetical protein NZ482_01865 [Gloeomargarita sp. SKYG98]|nr:hypothetical protein [Gloeomargarita sp. SKYG98]